MKNSITEEYIGVDLGDKKHHFCITDKQGNIVSEGQLANTKAELTKFAERHPQATLAMETGTHSPWISRLWINLGLQVIVANARELPMISKNMRKTDKNDARILARLVRVDPELLSPVKHGTEQMQKDQMVIKLRDSLVRRRADIVVTIRGVLKSLGYRLPSGSTNSFPKKIKVFMEEHPDFKIVLEPALATLEVCNTQIAQYDEQISEAVESHSQAKAFQQIPGVGPITALMFYLYIQDGNRFKDPRDVGAYLGLVPRRDQSGKIDKELPITKAGNKMLRRLLVQCSQFIMGSFGPDCALRDWGMKLVARGGRAAKKKAIIAVARKLATMMMAMWQKGEAYKAYPMEQNAAA